MIDRTKHERQFTKKKKKDKNPDESYKQKMYTKHSTQQKGHFDALVKQNKEKKVQDPAIFAKKITDVRNVMKT